MTKFNAGTAVEAMEYDFSDYKDDEGNPLPSGIIPEPTTDQMEAYFNGVRNIAQSVRDTRMNVQDMREKAGSGDLSNEEMEKILASMDQVSIKKFQGEICDLLGSLCSDQPSAIVLGRLPYRVLQAFMGWIQGNLRPEAGATGMN